MDKIITYESYVHKWNRRLRNGKRECQLLKIECKDNASVAGVCVESKKCCFCTKKGSNVSGLILFNVRLYKKISLICSYHVCNIDTKKGGFWFLWNTIFCLIPLMLKDSPIWILRKLRKRKRYYLGLSIKYSFLNF